MNTIDMPEPPELPGESAGFLSNDRKVTAAEMQEYDNKLETYVADRVEFQRTYLGTLSPEQAKDYVEKNFESAEGNFAQARIGHMVNEALAGKRDLSTEMGSSSNPVTDIEVLTGDKSSTSIEADATQDQVASNYIQPPEVSSGFTMG